MSEISYKAKISSMNLTTFFTKEQKKEVKQGAKPVFSRFCKE